MLNKQDSSIQYTTEFENNLKQLNFLDITITNNGTNSYDFKILRKPAITNLRIKTNSNMAPNVSQCNRRFTENGYERKTLEQITKNYLNELQNPPVNNKDTSEDINKVVKLPWIFIIGPKLRSKFKIVVMLKQDKAVT